MNIALWIVQAVLAAVFLFAGGMKLMMPIEDLVANGMNAFEGGSVALVRFIGLSEVAGGLGLILPAALRIKPKLTVAAAGALAFVMVLAVATHLWLGEPEAIGAPIVLGLLCAFVAWGRATKQAIAPREVAGASAR
ncbi:MAG TPA: DoxX family protein [Enhygromyxa sp.]|nr:DoxX family protein [Enhygromyxa sp.]